MAKQVNYGTTAKAFHWVIVALLVVQYPLGWLMPDIHGGMAPGIGMTWHISIGSLILVLIIARFIWRLTHPVVPESSLPPWQRFTSEAVHWLLYVLLLLTTLSGWLFASARGWAISWFLAVPMPMLTSGDRALVRALDGWHQVFEWGLLIAIGLHVGAAFVHLFYYHDGVMQRMLPGALRDFRRSKVSVKKESDPKKEFAQTAKQYLSIYELTLSREAKLNDQMNIIADIVRENDGKLDQAQLKEKALNTPRIDKDLINTAFSRFIAILLANDQIREDVAGKLHFGQTSR